MPLEITSPHSLGIRRQIGAEFSQPLGHALLADVTFRQFYSPLIFSSFTRRA
jgi:hypothetical protein